jgi:hypothetical protein
VGDLVYLPIVIVFFALMAGFVRLCDRILGADIDDGADDETLDLVTPEVAS